MAKAEQFYYFHTAAASRYTLTARSRHLRHIGRNGSDMNKRAKLLQRMRENPAGDWRIDDLKSVAKHYGISVAHHGTSHVQFRFPGTDVVTIPARRPIRPGYIRVFVDYIDTVSGILDM
jgi:hypothetical protein